MSVPETLEAILKELAVARSRSEDAEANVEVAEFKARTFLAREFGLASPSAAMVEMEIGDISDGELFALSHNVLMKTLGSGNIVQTSGAPFTREVKVYVARPKA